MALSWRGWRKRDNDPTDPVMEVTEGDQDINLAIGKARSTLDVFFEQLANQRPNQEGFLVKVRFSHGADVEHIWLADLIITNREMRGVIASEPYSRVVFYEECQLQKRSDYRLDVYRGQMPSWWFYDTGPSGEDELR